MNHRHKHLQRIKKKYKHLAAAIFGAAVLSSALLPGIPAATVHAAANPNANKAPVSNSQQIGKTSRTGSRIDLNSKAAPTENANQESSPTPTNSKADKAPETTPAAAKDTTKTSSDGAPTNYKKVLDIKATAYAPGAHDNDQWGDKTFMGTQIRPGVIAVDPSIIPLGSRVYVQYPDGHGEYKVAEDTGGAIKGNRIDVAMQSVDKAQDFGMKNVKVFVVSTPEKTEKA